MVTIAVMGQARQFVAAERGTAHISVRIENAEREVPLPAVANIHQQLVEAANAHVASGAATWWSADQVQLTTESRYVDELKVTERYFAATAWVQVKFANFESLGAWVLELGAIAGVELHEIEWTITDVTLQRVEREVRIAAVEDAQLRAATYAGALDLAAIELKAVYEPGLRSAIGRDGEAGWPGRPRRTSAKSGHVDRSGIDLRPDEIEVAASLSADFVAT